MKPAFTSKDKILIHFNRVIPSKLKEMSDEILRRKFVDHIATYKFGAPYAAKCFIETLQELTEEGVPQPSVKWVGPNRLYINEWVLISSDPDSEVGLEDIMEHEYSKDEKKWRLPHPYDHYVQQIARFHIGSHPQLNTYSREQEGLPRLTEEEQVKYNLKKKVEGSKTGRMSHKTPNTEAVPRKSKPSKEGMVTLADICTSLKCDPKEARQALRKAKIEKPDAGWAWPKDQEKKITETVSKALKNLRDK